MRITVDTNVLIRAVVRDDKKQAAAADKALQSAEVIAVTLPCLCEFVWVLRKVYGISQADIAQAIRTLLSVANVAADRAAAEAGLAVLEAGGDFADGVIAHDGGRLGGEAFISFDKQAIKLIQATGLAAKLP
ncbi:type II toxin-antitoxin system VapC family toxin [Hydrocarboniphaga sp.]|uniref:type II toxin-antitoxin system VapC family toxin n=1 Tax=Hydrocarboniphaga sp. TaxID=2033016 RepID=UPI003D12A8EB